MPRTAAWFGRKNSFKVRLKQATVYSIIAVALFCIAGLVGVSFTRQGVLLIKLNDFLLGQLGTLATFFLPFPIIVGGMMLTKIRSSLSAPHTFVGSVVILAALTGISNGGTIGNQLWQASSSFLSPVGAGLLLLAGLGIGLIIMFNVPFEDVLAFVVNLTVRSRRAVAGLNKSDKLISKPIKMGGMPAPAAAINKSIYI